MAIYRGFGIYYFHQITLTEPDCLARASRNVKRLNANIQYLPESAIPGYDDD